MKNYFKYAWSLMLLGALGCSDFGNTNVSPNGSAVPLTSALLTNSLASGGYAGATGTGVTSGLYCQYFSQTLYTDASRYSLQDVNWGDLSGIIYDLQNIININSDPSTAAYAALNGSNNNQIAVARILKAHRFSVLTDRYGDMPYSEALKGKPNPKFDTQQSIYTDLFKELKEAVAQFDNLPPAINGDILFNGDISRWKKYANSLRLILALRISKADPTKGSQEFNDVITNLGTNGGVLTTSADDITLTYPGNATEFYNPWFGFGADQNVSATVANFLNTNTDDRRFGFGNVVAPSTNLVGMPYGYKRDDALNWTSQPANKDHSLILNNAYRDKASTLTILTAADVLLARAEAAVPVAKGGLGWTSEDYAAMYANGIMESWKHWNQYGTGTNYNAYMTKPVVDLASSTSTIAEKIATQRWISFYPNGDQGWAEWRRTGFPVLAPAPQPANLSGLIPVRFIYFTGEYGLNPDNIKAAVALLDNGDTQESHVWWDK